MFVAVGTMLSGCVSTGPTQSAVSAGAGGGMQGGQVVGASDAKGEGPRDRVISPDDVAATFYHALGVDHTKEYHTPTGRPVMIVRHGKLIQELV